jgi:hypothetical protein
VKRGTLYDNPATMAREMWFAGKMLGHLQAALICTRGFRGHRSLHYAFSVGPWCAGQILGPSDNISAAALAGRG